MIYCLRHFGDREIVNLILTNSANLACGKERSPIRDIEIKYLLKSALTDEVNSREVYMKGIDHSYYDEGYTTFKTEEL